MTAVLGVSQYFLSFGEHRLRDRRRGFDLPFFRQKIALGPIFPGLERLTVDFGRKLHAKTFD